MSSPSILYASNQIIQLDKKLIWNYKGPVNFDDLEASLNATNVYQLLKEGLDVVKENAISIKRKLEQFCGKGRFHPLQNIPAYAKNASQSKSTPYSVNTVYEMKFNEEYNKLKRFIKETEKDLNSLLYGMNDLKQYMNSIESLYCPEENANKCWNGSSFDTYTRHVPEFALGGQMNNPEVKITSRDLQFHLPLEKAGKGGYHAMNLQNDILSTNKNSFTEESSGIRPQFLLTDLDIPQMEPHYYEPGPPKLSAEFDSRQENSDMNALSDHVVVQGCSMDDEDCELHFADSYIDENESDENNRLVDTHTSLAGSLDSKQFLTEGRSSENEIKETVTSYVPVKSRQSHSELLNFSVPHGENSSISKITSNLMLLVCPLVLNFANLYA
ncbi:unnamed protein product [Heterobilharzia americana]|nr:unnamed protein product [Heterobilharzia americana]